MLNEGARIVAEIADAEPRTPYAEKNLDTLCEISAPIDNEEESCYFLKLCTPKISLENEQLCKRFTLSYSINTLPEFVLWKSPASGDYALGLEPTTTKLDDAFAYRTIQKGESVQFELRLGAKKI